MINRYDYESLIDVEQDCDLIVAMRECSDPRQLKSLEQTARKRLHHRAREARAQERARHTGRRGLSRVLNARTRSH